MTTATTKQRYYSPTRSVDAEVSLREFDIDELRNEIAHREGGVVDTGEGYTLSSGMINRLSTLVLCSQRDAALRELCMELEPYVGKLLP